MLNLTWGDVDLKQKRLTVRESKAGEARHVPMNEVVIQTLQSLPRMLHNPYVFLWSQPWRTSQKRNQEHGLEAVSQGSQDRKLSLARLETHVRFTARHEGNQLVHRQQTAWAPQSGHDREVFSPCAGLSSECRRCVGDSSSTSDTRTDTGG